MTSAARRFAPPILFFSLLLGGCGAGASGTGDPAGGDGGDDDPGGQCEGPLGAPRDPDTLVECCQPEGGSHCLPTAIVPEDFRQHTPACDDGGLCVPDVFIETGGVYAPPSCASLNGAAGVCLSACIPQVAEVAALLPTEGCGRGERCVPCISPLDNQPTGACDIVGECLPDDDDGGAGGDPPPAIDGDDPATCVHEGPPVVDPRGLTPCGEGAHCLQATLVPPEFAGRLGPCADAAYRCVPDVFVATGGDFIPPTCRSVSDSEGRCLSRVLPEVAAQADLLPVATCGAGELCVPCFSPIDGQSTGACDVSCDTGPTEPARQLAACCEGQARCVPAAAVPAELQSNLEQGDCADVDDGLLCVPDDLLAYQQGTGPAPPACEATGFLIGDYTGVCLSNCLSFGLQGAALARGDCDAGNTCAPCVNPLNGTPTGAPGCPAAP
jgi:hypothetical protein